MPLTTADLLPPHPEPTFDLVITTDGRARYLERMFATLDNVVGTFQNKIVVNDSGDRSYANFVEDLTVGLGFTQVFHPERRGLAATVADAWAQTDADYVFHCEDDFVFPERVFVHELIKPFDVRVRLAQVCLLRQPWNDDEQRAGGIIQQHPDDYAEHSTDGVRFCVHRRLFSLNPCVIPRWVVAMGWDEGNERGFTDRLLADPKVEFAYFGGKDDPPRVCHIGVARAAGWTL